MEEFGFIWGITQREATKIAISDQALLMTGVAIRKSYELLVYRIWEYKKGKHNKEISPS